MEATSAAAPEMSLAAASPRCHEAGRTEVSPAALQMRPVTMCDPEQQITQFGSPISSIFLLPEATIPAMRSAGHHLADGYTHLLSRVAINPHRSKILR
ncbi:hypothetical protein GH714_018257 [Hevea brasiliensis]|uniref:Uncharacterized protein n=1 Tax=Hevea brasiliensis TaxID=3981 RepID=A0A6A6LT60_HEVBR|nr:hypothetical protein GH714_018257 [Hevea brasiliensis]